MVFDDMIVDMFSNKKLIIKSSFALPKNIKLNSTHYFIMKILNKPELLQ